MDRTELVFHDCDGGCDDLITSMLLRRAKGVQLVGTVISNASCYVDASFNAMRRIEHCTSVAPQPVGLWHDEMPNPFPEKWRQSTRRYSDLPILAGCPVGGPEPMEAVALMQRSLRSASQPLTMICTGPLTVVADVLNREPQLGSKIRQLVIMGGAIRVRGNVARTHGGDGTAEWNVFCDPLAFKAVLASGISIRLVSLDITQHLPVDKPFLTRLRAQSSPDCQVAAALWGNAKNVYLWDPTTAMAMIRPDLFRFERFNIDVMTNGPSQGRLVMVPAGQGTEVSLAFGVYRNRVLDAVLELLGAANSPPLA